MLEENIDACRAYLGCSTQVRRGFDGTFLGFDYAAVEAWMRMHRFRDRADTLERLQVIEDELLPKKSDNGEDSGNDGA